MDDRGCRRLEGEAGLEIDSAVQEIRRVTTHRTPPDEIAATKNELAVHEVEWHTTQNRAVTGKGQDRGWRCDVRLTSQQKQYEDGTIELVTKLSASEGLPVGEGAVDAETPWHPVLTREWRDQVHTA